MLKSVALPFCALVLMQSATALAQSDDGDWFESPATESEAPETEAPQEASSEEPAAEEAKPAPAKVSETKTADGTKVVVIETGGSDPQHDETTIRQSQRGVRTHDGFYLRMSLGGGSLAASGQRWDSSGSEREYTFEGNAVHGDLAIGGTPMPGVVLGGAYLGSYAARAHEAESGGEDVGMSFGVVGPFIDVYPDPHGGLHFGGMLGPAGTVSYDDEYMEQTAAIGFGGGVWVGYDFWISNQWSLGGVLRASAARVETPPNRELLEERDRLGVGSVALLVSATYH